MNFLSIFRKLPWWAWVLVGLAVLYLFNVTSGSIYSRKLWNMIHDQIVRPSLLPPSTDLDALAERFRKRVGSLRYWIIDFGVHILHSAIRIPPSILCFPKSMPSDCSASMRKPLGFEFLVSDFGFTIPHSAIGMDQKIALLEQRVSGSRSRITPACRQTGTRSRYFEAGRVGKPKSNWELQGVLDLATFVLGFLARQVRRVNGTYQEPLPCCNPPSLELPFHPQKCQSKAKISLRSSHLLHKINNLSWSDPRSKRAICLCECASGFSFRRTSAGFSLALH